MKQYGELNKAFGLQIAELVLMNGQEKTNTIAITNVFQHQQGQWVMKLAHAVALE